MGAHKRDHIGMMLAMESIASQWREINDANPTFQDIERLYESYITLQAELVLNHASLIPGVLEMARRFAHIYRQTISDYKTAQISETRVQ